MKRTAFLEQIALQHRVHPICGILGPRQVGKTTLAKQYAESFSEVYFFDLENPEDRARLQDPFVVLSTIQSGLIVIDEVQRVPELFQILRVVVDEHKPRKFLILGSASRDLLQQSSESLAGRIGYIELPTFLLQEIVSNPKKHDLLLQEGRRLWFRGGYPLSYLAQTDEESFLWRRGYISTFAERDVPALGFNVPSEQVKRLWMMLAHNHAGMLNLSQLGNSLGLSHTTVRKYIDILTGTFMVRELKPWFENIGKRQVKLPKVYIRDSGMINALLGISTVNDFNMRPQQGSLWEGFALEEIIKEYKADVDECFFWRAVTGAELDLLIVKNGKKIGFEFKYNDVPTVTRSMRVALNDLQLDHLYIVTPLGTSYSKEDKITARGLGPQ